MSDSLDQLFAEDGKIAALIDGYDQRPGQLSMAHLVSDSIAAGNHAMIEAGSGSGKTLAYLAGAAESGFPILVSTATRTLQDQLLTSDLPLLAEAIAADLRVSVLRGRRNYVCAHRLSQHLSGGQCHPRDYEQLLAVRRWYNGSPGGDLTHFDGDLSLPVRLMATSEAANCLNRICPARDQCAYYRAWEKARGADVVIVNHHLLLAELITDENGNGRLPGGFAGVIVDEAHQLPELVRAVFCRTIESAAVATLVRDLEAETRFLGGDDVALLEVLRAITGWLDQSLSSAGRDRVDAVIAMLDALELLLGELDAMLAPVSERSVIFRHGLQRVRRMIDDIGLLLESPVELIPDPSRQGQFIFREVVGDAGERFGQAVAESGVAWVFVSATMTVDRQFGAFRAMTGLTHVEVRESVQAQSYDYVRQVMGYVPKLSVAPLDEGHSEALFDAITPYLTGKLMLLVTSHRALGTFLGLLRNHGVRVFAQGERPTAALIADFIDAEDGVLLGTYSFWEGIDVRGAGLKCLVIDKLPFHSPDDPVVRHESFDDYHVPLMVTRMRQGFGRLIRDRTDRGLFILGDPRLLTTRYGARLQASLPDMGWTADARTAEKFWSEL